MYVFSALGFFPVCNCDGGISILLGRVTGDENSFFLKLTLFRLTLFIYALCMFFLKFMGGQRIFKNKGKTIFLVSLYTVFVLEMHSHQGWLKFSNCLKFSFSR